MRKFLVTFDEKVTTSGVGEIYTYRLEPYKRIIRANTSSEARKKMRKDYGYGIVNIHIEEVKKSWLKRLLRLN